ncbi:MAG: galactokinase [Sphaerochaetaceae bacterium]
MNQINNLHFKEFGDNPSVRISVPGVYSILGEFADYCSGYTLYAGSGNSLNVVLSPRKDQSVRMFLAPLGERKRINLLNIKYRREDRWANYLKGVFAIFNTRGYHPAGCNITFSGTLLSEETETLRSAMALGVALGCNELNHLELSVEDCAHVAYSSLSQFVGEPSRLTRFLAMLFVKADSYLFFDVLQMNHEYIPFRTDNRFVSLVIESNISPQAFKEEIRNRRQECASAFQKLSSLFPSRILRDLKEEEIKEARPHLSEDDKRLISYVLAESRATKEAAALLEQNEMVMYGRLLSRVQVGLRDVFEISCPEIDWLTKRSGETSRSYGSAMIGGGSSGSIIVLIDKEAISIYADRMEEYEHIFGFKPLLKEFFPSGELKIDLNI